MAHLCEEAAFLQHRFLMEYAPSAATAEHGGPAPSEERGCHEAIIAGYHGLFTGPAIERLERADAREIVVTDSIPISEEKRLPNMTVLPVSHLFADAIGRIHSGQSVGALFQ